MAVESTTLTPDAYAFAYARAVATRKLKNAPTHKRRAMDDVYGAHYLAAASVLDRWRRDGSRSFPGYFRRSFPNTLSKVYRCGLGNGDRHRDGQRLALEIRGNADAIPFMSAPDPEPDLDGPSRPVDPELTARLCDLADRAGVPSAIPIIHWLAAHPEHQGQGWAVRYAAAIGGHPVHLRAILSRFTARLEVLPDGRSALSEFGVVPRRRAAKTPCDNGPHAQTGDSPTT